MWSEKELEERFCVGGDAAEGKPVLQGEAKRQEDTSWYNKHAGFNLRYLFVKAAMGEASSFSGIPYGKKRSRTGC